MIPETLIALKTQLPAKIEALRLSYGITASPSDAKRAAQLAPTIEAIRPGVYQVGNCTADLWRMGCTCQTARTRKRKLISPSQDPCPHFIALYLANSWTPIDPDPVLYLRNADVQRPIILTRYAHARGPLYLAIGNAEKPTMLKIDMSGMVEILAISEYTGYLLVKRMATNRHYLARPESLIRVRSVYQ